MKTIKFTYWQDGDYYLGFLNDYPDYQTQGMWKEELVRNLKDLLADLESGEVPYVREPVKRVAMSHPPLPTAYSCPLAFPKSEVRSD